MAGWVDATEPDFAVLTGTGPRESIGRDSHAFLLFGGSPSIASGRRLSLLPGSVTVAQEILVLFVLVRIQAG